MKESIVSSGKDYHTSIDLNRQYSTQNLYDLSFSGVNTTWDAQGYVFVSITAILIILNVNLRPL